MSISPNNFSTEKGLIASHDTATTKPTTTTYDYYESCDYQPLPCRCPTCKGNQPTLTDAHSPRNCKNSYSEAEANFAPNLSPMMKDDVKKTNFILFHFIFPTQLKTPEKTAQNGTHTHVYTRVNLRSPYI